MSDPNSTAEPETGLSIPEQAKFSNAPTPALQELAWTARALVNAVTVPRAIQGKPGDILAVMLAGRELGIGPMASTRLVHIINGQTSIATELKLAIASRAGCSIEPLEEGDGFCIAYCRTHPDAGSIGWAMTLDHAAAASSATDYWTIASDILYETWEDTPSGGRKKVERPLTEKPNWRNYERDMLFWRAASQFVRRHRPGVAGGLYTVEELGGNGESEANA